MARQYAIVNIGPKYGQEYTDRITAMLKRHDHEGRLHVQTDYSLDLNFVTPAKIGKLELFNPQRFKGVNAVLYIDVDNVILRDLTPLWEFNKDADIIFHRPWDNKRGRLAAGVMRFRPRGGPAMAIWRYAQKLGKPRHWPGDQAFMEAAFEDVQDLHFFPNWWIGSYKWITGQDAQGKVAGTWDETIVLCCHGEMNPSDIIEKKLPGWEIVKEAWA